MSDPTRELLRLREALRLIHKNACQCEVDLSGAGAFVERSRAKAGLRDIANIASRALMMRGRDDE